jgi:agarase
MARAGRTRWGGIFDDRVTGTCFFRVETLDGVWWLVDPDGGRFISKGVCNVSFDPDQIQGTDRAPYAAACRRKYGGIQQWQTAVARRLASWGFNSLGAWSDDAVAVAAPVPLAVAPIVHLGAAFIGHQERQGKAPVGFPDVFDPDFASFVQRMAIECCTPRRDEPGIIGWFTDNELPWGPDWRGQDEPLTLFLNQPAACSGRVAAIAHLRERHRDIASFNAVWRGTATGWDGLSHIEPPFRRDPLYAQSAEVERQRNAADPRRAAFVADCDAFAGALAERYFAVTVAAVQAADPNHLVLGPRFGYAPQTPVVAAAGRHLDVIAFNAYDADPLRTIDVYARTGRPCLVGEFSFRGDDSGLPNTRGGGLRVATQEDRARSFERYVSAGLRRPSLVGYHWFEHADQPAEGRFDGENSNYGTVTINDDVYGQLTRAMTALNGRAEEVHAAADRVRIG